MILLSTGEKCEHLDKRVSSPQTKNVIRYTEKISKNKISN